MLPEWQTSTVKLEKISVNVLYVEPFRGLGYLLFVDYNQPPWFWLCNVMVTAGTWREGKSRWRVWPPAARKACIFLLGVPDYAPHNYNMLWSGLWKEFCQSAAGPRGHELPMGGGGDLPKCSRCLFTCLCWIRVELDLAAWQTMVSKLVGII